ncbi:MAG: XTP/dITP diphosphatase [Desulfobacterales bacterium]|nr:XTP/dITP diphosphatase [Desulfobacterales bacterium]
MRPILTIVIASRNKGKKVEIQELLNDFPVNIKTLDDFGPVPEIAENGTTFEENAYQKASSIARILGLPALADDSGLVVEVLDGRPGVYSARYAGEDATDRQRCLKLLEEMEGQANRSAVFECVVSIAVPSGSALTYEGKCEGLIAQTTSGSGGFGYDPVFFYPPAGKTFAEMTAEEKNSVSHRGKALRDLCAEFEKALIWIRQHMPLPEPGNCKGD